MVDIDMSFSTQQERESAQNLRSYVVIRFFLQLQPSIITVTSQREDGNKDISYQQLSDSNKVHATGCHISCSQDRIVWRCG